MGSGLPFFQDLPREVRFRHRMWLPSTQHWALTFMWIRWSTTYMGVGIIYQHPSVGILIVSIPWELQSHRFWICWWGFLGLECWSLRSRELLISECAGDAAIQIVGASMQKGFLFAQSGSRTFPSSTCPKAAIPMEPRSSKKLNLKAPLDSLWIRSLGFI